MAQELKQSKRLTMVQIAKEAGVSTTTVSKVLNQLPATFWLCEDQNCTNLYDVLINKQNASYALDMANRITVTSKEDLVRIALRYVILVQM